MRQHVATYSDADERSLTLCTALLLSATYVPGLADILRVHPPDVRGWSVVLTFSIVPTVIGQILLSRPWRARAQDAVNVRPAAR